MVLEVMNVQMRLQKQPSAQQSQLSSDQQLIYTQSQRLLSTILKSGRLNGMDALLINCTPSNLTLVYCSVTHLGRRDAVTLRRLHIGHVHVLLINIY